MVRRGVSWLVCGPPGSGKTYLARQRVAALACDAPRPNGAACEVCMPCRAILAGNERPGVYLCGPDRQQRADLRALAAQLRRPALPGGPVVLLDDADRLQGWECLKEALDAKRDNAPTVIVVVRDPSSVPFEIKDRLQIEPLPAPSRAARERLVKLWIEQDGLGVDPEQAGQVASLATNLHEARSMLQALAGPEAGAATLAKQIQARQSFFEAYLAAIAIKDVRGQVQALTGGGMPPEAVVSDLLRHLADMRLLAPAEAGEQAAIRMRDAFRSAAAALGLTTSDLWTRLTTFWSGQERGTDLERLRLLAIQFADAQSRLALGDEGGDTPLISSTAPRTTALPDGEDRYLSFDQVLELYEAATFALQIYGAPFNTELVVQWQDLPEDRLSRSIINLTQKLQRKFERLGCAKTNNRILRILLNARDAKGVATTTIVFHAPPAHRQAWNAWRPKCPEASSLEFRKLPAQRTRDLQIQTHWDLMRGLWAHLHPNCRIGGHAVLDVLRVPEDVRRPLGPLVTRRVFSKSEAIDQKVQTHLMARGLGHHSALADGAFSWVDSGWELDEWRRWSREGIDRKAELLNADAGKDAQHPFGRGNGSQLGVMHSQQKQIDNKILTRPPWDRLENKRLSEAEEAAKMFPLFDDLPN